MKRSIGMGTLWLVAGLVLASCGFHFRGGGISGLPPIYVDGGNPRKGIRLAVDRTLHGSGEKIVAARDQAQVILSLAQETYRKWPLSISSQLAVQEYELIYTVSFRVTDPTGKVLIPPQSVEFTRDYSFSSTAQVLGKENEEDILHQEMIGDAARQILTQLLIFFEQRNHTSH